MIATYDTQNVTWAIEIWVNEPWPPNSVAKNSSRLIPITISGRHHRQEQENLHRSSPALADPRQPETEQRPERDRRDHRDRRDLEGDPERTEDQLVRNSVGYQSRVNPAQLKFRLSALKLKMIRMTIGRNRKT